MPLLVLFVFGAVVLGAGAMLSPAWPTAQPRVGLAATLALALIIGGAVFWAMAFGWDTLVIDYMLFALIIGIFLGGTLSFGQSRAEKQGEVLLDSEQGWPGPEDLIFFGIVALLLAIPPLFLQPVENANTTQLAAAALTARDERTFDFPVVLGVGDADDEAANVLYPPGYSALSAYLSQQLSQTPELVQLAVAAVIALLCVWLMYDLGAELGDKYLGRAMAVALLFIPGFWMLYLNGHYTALLGMAFTLAFLIYAYRVWRHGKAPDMIGAGLLLGATIIAEPNAFPLALAGYIAVILAEVVGRREPLTGRGLLLGAAVPVIALIATAPWLLNGLLPNQDAPRYLLDSGRGGDVLAILAFHGIGLIALAALGLWTTSRPTEGETGRQRFVLAVGLGAWGVIAALLFDYGAILPLALLAGFGLLWLWEKVMTPRGRTFVITAGLGLALFGFVSVILAGSMTF